MGCCWYASFPLLSTILGVLGVTEKLSKDFPLNVSGFGAACKGRDTGQHPPSCHLAHTCGDSSGLACPTRASQAQARPLSSEHQPCEGFTKSPSVPCVSERPCLPKRRRRYHLLPCPRPTGALVRSTPLCTAVRTAVVTLAVGWGLGIFGSTALPVVAPGVSATISLVKGQLRDVMFSQQSQGRACRTCLLQQQPQRAPPPELTLLDLGPCAGTCLMVRLHRTVWQSALTVVRW